MRAYVRARTFLKYYTHVYKPLLNRRGFFVPKFLKSTLNTQKDEKKQKYKWLIFSAL